MFGVKCEQKRVLPAREIKMYILDEADQMVDTQGFRDTSLNIKKYRLFVSLIFFWLINMLCVQSPAPNDAVAVVQCHVRPARG